MKLKENLERLGANSEFKEWKESNPGYVLAHAFVMIDEANKDIWQIGFYSEKEDKMATFMLEPNDIRMAETTEIFKDPNAKILEVNPEDVKISVEDAMDRANNFRLENYPKNTVMKTFFIIQNLNPEGQVFNITFVSQEMNTINIKISTKDGKVVKHHISSLMDMAKVDKK
jgi:hypothetical protein